MANEMFSIKDALGYGWQAFKKHALFLIGLLIVSMIIMGVVQFAVGSFAKPGAGIAAIGVGIALTSIARAIVTMCNLRLTLNIRDRDMPDVNSLSTMIPVFLPFLIGLILLGVIGALASVPVAAFLVGAAMVQNMAIKVLLGLLGLACLPILVYVIVMFMFAPFVIVDRGVGPIEALKESKSLTEGVRWELFLFWAALVVLNILGLVALLIGLLITYPVSSMATNYVYRKLQPASAS
jgi:uncharacterized membrane protein